jgi:hypothetical protein
MSANDYYSKIAGAKATGGGTPIRDGIYTLIIDKTIEHAGATGETSFIAEFRVLEAAVDPNNPDVKPNPVGSSCSMAANMKHQSALGNVKAFCLGALGAFGFQEDQLTPEVIKRAFNSEDLRGVILKNSTYRTINKGRTTPANAGKPLTLNRWESVPQTADDVARQKADLIAGKYSVTAAGPAPAQAAAPGTAAPAPATTSLLGRR